MDATGKKSVTLTGTPAEIGGQIWERYCLPAVRRMSNEASPVALQQLYVGFLSSAIGAMTADFGHEHAVLLAQRMVDRPVRMMIWMNVLRQARKRCALH